MIALDKIRIGTIVNTHGIKGEVKVLPDTDFQAFRYASNQALWIESNDQYIPVKIVTYRIHKGFDLLLFEGYNDINQVEGWKRCGLFAPDLPVPNLGKNEFHINSLLGMNVVQNEQLKGVVCGIRTYPQGDYLEVKTTKDVVALIPFRDEFVLNVDASKKLISIVEMEGLIE